MKKIFDILNILKKDSSLYQECGSLFRYLGEVRINFSSLEFHNVPWQISQILEIVYSNRMDNLDLNIFGVLISYSSNQLKNSNEKIASWANFNGTFFISKLRKENKNISLKSYEQIIELVQKNYNSYQEFDSKNFLKNLTEEELTILPHLLNGDFSNNPLYFFPIYLLIIEDSLKNIKHKNVLRSIFVNMYLMKNKLLFAPTLSFSYPLFYEYDDYIELIEMVREDPERIIDFSRFIFDILKQASVISRAFILDYSKTCQILKRLFSKNHKELEGFNINKFFELISFDEKILTSYTKGKNPKKSKDIIEFLYKNNLIKDIIVKNAKVYIFKNYLNSIKKLNKNKTQKTTKIFTLKENMN